MRIAGVAVLTLGVLAGFAALTARDDQSFERQATVASVVDGDTLVALVEGHGRDRVRVLGIDTPERGACFAGRATSEARALALGRRVELQGDSSQRERDRHGRLLAYVKLPGGRDLGLELLSGGYARVLTVGRPFERVEEYRRAEQAGRRLSASIWRC